MATLKDILVTTTSNVDGLKVKQYLKPVSAHIVAGTNLFGDFLGGLSDVFGGRSQTYQKQLISLHNEAIERIKVAAHEIGANCILGLSIDMDEISGKGKSMFMLTALGTAVILERKESDSRIQIAVSDKIENVGVERIGILRRKKEILEKAESENLDLSENVWDFISVNQIDEIFPYVLIKYSEALPIVDSEIALPFYTHMTDYVANLPEPLQIKLLYDGIQNQPNEKLVAKLAEIIKQLQLFNSEKCMMLLKTEKFEVKKTGVRIASYDKPFYNRQDIEDLQSIINFIAQTFVERGKRIMKKQMLSSKEKEVWTCECGKTNELADYCSGCEKDIYGFKKSELKPLAVQDYLRKKIEFIKELIG